MTFYVRRGCLTLPIVFKYLNVTSPRGSLDVSFLTLTYEMMNQLTFTTGNSFAKVSDTHLI